VVISTSASPAIISQISYPPGSVEYGIGSQARSIEEVPFAWALKLPGAMVCVLTQSPPFCLEVRKLAKAASSVYRAFHLRSENPSRRKFKFCNVIGIDPLKLLLLNPSFKSFDK
jgi:hypothetical protein